MLNAADVPGTSAPALQEPKKHGGKAISDNVRGLLINAHQQGISYRQMAVLYGVKEDTAYRICSRRQYTTRKRGGPRATKLCPEAVNFLLAAIEDRPDLTLQEMKTFLETQKNVVVSTSTIARKLEGQLVTLKKLELVPERRNCLENREARRRHAQWLQGAHEQGARFCFVDECGYNLYTARTRGRSVKGLPARKVVENQRTPHITIMCAVCPGIGLMHYATIVGGAKQEQFDNFVRALVSRDFGQPMVPHHDTTKRCIIYDNAPCHRGVEERLADSVPEDLELVRLPPYSCPLNPIEYCFQSVKAHIKRSLSQHDPVLPEEGQTLVAARRQLLVNLMPESLTEITPLSCLNSFYHVLTVTAPAALRLENL